MWDLIKNKVNNELYDDQSVRNSSNSYYYAKMAAVQEYYIEHQCAADILAATSYGLTLVWHVRVAYRMNTCWFNSFFIFNS